MGPQVLAELVAAREAALTYYSPYYFLRHLSVSRQQALFGTGLVLAWGQKPGTEVYDSPGTQWLMQQLSWDTDYFGVPMFRVFTGLFKNGTTVQDLVEAAQNLRLQLSTRHPTHHAFAIVPAEDIRLLQGLTGAGWSLVETRLTYYRDKLSQFTHASYPVRAAEAGEAALIGRIAAAARNPYDRVHADPWFGDVRADVYLARYAENTVAAGLATTVLVPDIAGLAVDSFLAISDLETDAVALGTRLSRVLLTAVGAANRGWHVKLVAETLHRAQTLGHEAVLMTTPATNHAVFRTCEKLGFRLGATSHVLACHSR
ncbi:hypothetical protein [Hymenobacter rubidus]|uniref:hypothetical protein n=1 Tax=Hymenobacter rubidus TaxID=1441626 RepID=UPI00191D6F20|nr:hypothetical protein [Hymenobacter rubidus]